MTVLTIRSHRRYALRMFAKMGVEGADPASCLLIELSQHGARISNLGHRAFAVGANITIETETGHALHGRVRWFHDGLAGVHLTRALYLPELAEIVEANRRAAEIVTEERRYGT